MAQRHAVCSCDGAGRVAVNCGQAAGSAVHASPAHALACLLTPLLAVLALPALLPLGAPSCVPASVRRSSRAGTSASVPSARPNARQRWRSGARRCGQAPAARRVASRAGPPRMRMTLRAAVPVAGAPRMQQQQHQQAHSRRTPSACAPRRRTMQHSAPRQRPRHRQCPTFAALSCKRWLILY